MQPTTTLALLTARAIRERHLYGYSFSHARKLIATLRAERAAVNCSARPTL